MSSFLSKKIGICCKCLNEICEYDEYSFISRGMIHDSCLEDHVDDKWRELSFIEKREILEERNII